MGVLFSKSQVKFCLNFFFSLSLSLDWNSTQKVNRRFKRDSEREVWFDSFEFWDSFILCALFHFTFWNQNDWLPMPNVIIITHEMYLTKKLNVYMWNVVQSRAYNEKIKEKRIRLNFLHEVTCLVFVKKSENYNGMNNNGKLNLEVFLYEKFERISENLIFFLLFFRSL